MKRRYKKQIRFRVKEVAGDPRVREDTLDTYYDSGWIDEDEDFLLDAVEKGAKKLEKENEWAETIKEERFVEV